jgi:predicted  nucleic acid-binding Zn-ribbon protein
MDIVTKLEDAYAFLGDPLHREAANEIERLREKLTKQNEDIEELKKTIETLEEEVYVHTSDLTHVFVGMNHKE